MIRKRLKLTTVLTHLKVELLCVCEGNFSFFVFKPNFAEMVKLIFLEIFMIVSFPLDPACIFLLQSNETLVILCNMIYGSLKMINNDVELNVLFEQVDDRHSNINLDFIQRLGTQLLINVQTFLLSPLLN